MQGASVLITGSRGFTGHYLAQQLRAAGYRVYGTLNRGEPGTDEFVVDLQDQARLEEVVQQVQPDYVVHLAAIAFVAHHDVDALYHVNLLGTRRLLAALAGLRKTPRAVLLASSANIYGNSTRLPITEETPPQPANDYAVSKLAMEHMAMLWQDKLPLIIARPFNYTGVGQADNFLLPKIVRHFREARAGIELGNLDVARDFSDVRMVVESYRRLLEVAPAGAIVNICSGHATTLDEVLQMMREISGHQLEVSVNPAFVRANEVKILLGSNARLQQLIGELPAQDLRATLRWMYQA